MRFVRGCSGPIADHFDSDSTTAEAGVVEAWSSRRAAHSGVPDDSAGAEDMEGTDDGDAGVVDVVASSGGGFREELLANITHVHCEDCPYEARAARDPALCARALTLNHFGSDSTIAVYCIHFRLIPGWYSGVTPGSSDGGDHYVVSRGKPPFGRRSRVDK